MEGARLYAWTPSCCNRPRNSPAARVVNVTARTADGVKRPVATPYAIRCVMARVLPVPAPAMTATGPSDVVATARCSGSNRSSSASGLDGARPVAAWTTP